MQNLSFLRAIKRLRAPPPSRYFVINFKNALVNPFVTTTLSLCMRACWLALKKKLKPSTIVKSIGKNCHVGSSFRHCWLVRSPCRTLKSTETTIWGMTRRAWSTITVKSLQQNISAGAWNTAAHLVASYSNKKGKNTEKKCVLCLYKHCIAAVADEILL